MPYDAEATKSRIFEAAAAEFAERGIAGARVSRIADRAHASKQLLYAYFGDKEQLFAAVLQRRLKQLAEAVVLDPTRVPEYVGELFDFHIANSDLTRLVQWEALHYDSQEVPNEAARAARYREKAAAVAEAQEQGRVDPSLDHRQLMFVLLSLAGWWSTVPQIARMLIGEDPRNPETLMLQRAHIVEAARRIVNPGAHNSERSP